MRKSLAKWLPQRICKESVAITLSTNCDLAIECLGVRAIESLDVLVATIVVMIMKRKKEAVRRTDIPQALVHPLIHSVLHAF